MRIGTAGRLLALLVLGLCGCGDGSPADVPGPPPDPEADGCAPWAWYDDGAVPRRPVASWLDVAWDVAAADGLVVVACGNGGLRLIDTAAPTPRIVGHVGAGYAEELAIDGDLLAVAENAFGFSLYDISDPAAPVLQHRRRVVGTGRYGGSAGQTFHVALGGGELFVAGNYHQVVRFDVRDPARPVERERLELGHDGPALALVDGYLYVGLEKVFDLAGPGLVEVAAPGETGVWELARRGRWLHAAAETGLVTADVSRPAAPQLGDRRDHPGAGTLAVSGDRVFLGGERLGVLVYDFLVPDDPVLVGSALPGETLAGLALADGVLYAADGWRLQGLDVRDPAVPQPVFAWDSPGSAVDLAVAGQAAVVADGLGLRVYALGAGLADRPLAEVRDPDRALRADDLTPAGTRVLFTRGDGGWQILDVAQPAAPALSAVFAPERRFSTLAVDGGRLAAAAGEDLLLYDLGGAAEPVPLGSVPCGDGIDAVILDGTSALVSLDAGQLVLLDLADPASPVEVARDAPNPARCDSRAVWWAQGRGFDLHGDPCCAVRPVTADGQGGFAEGPVEILGELPLDLAVSGAAAYVLVRELRGDPQAWEEDIVALDLREAGRVRVLGRAMTPRGGYRRLAAADGFLYALESGGVVRYWPDCVSVDDP